MNTPGNNPSLHPPRPGRCRARDSAGRAREDGFTLVEIMVAMAIGSIIMAAVMTTYIISIRGFRAIANYAEIHGDGRLAIDYFARDMRGVSAIVKFGSSYLVVTIPTEFSNTGSAIAQKTVIYSISNGTLYRTDSATGTTSALAHNIYHLQFQMYDKVGNPTTLTSHAKGIQVDIKLRKNVQRQFQTEDFLSARLDMRNVP